MVNYSHMCRASLRFKNDWGNIDRYQRFIEKFFFRTEIKPYVYDTFHSYTIYLHVYHTFSILIVAPVVEETLIVARACSNAWITDHGVELLPSLGVKLDNL